MSKIKISKVKTKQVDYKLSDYDLLYLKFRKVKINSQVYHINKTNYEQNIYAKLHNDWTNNIKNRYDHLLNKLQYYERNANKVWITRTRNKLNVLDREIKRNQNRVDQFLKKYGNRLSDLNGDLYKLSYANLINSVTQLTYIDWRYLTPGQKIRVTQLMDEGGFSDLDELNEYISLL